MNQRRLPRTASSFRHIDPLRVPASHAARPATGKAALHCVSDLRQLRWSDAAGSVKRTWRLNERHYGALQGKDKAETLAQYGEEQFQLWRRSFDVPPPPIDPTDTWAQQGDPRYADIEAYVPKTESLKIVIDRLLPYWTSDIAPDVAVGKVTLVVAHGNSLRALVKHLEGISEADIAELNNPTGIPLAYELGDDLKPLAPGRYLDPEAAQAGAAAGAGQGKKKR